MTTGTLLADLPPWLLAWLFAASVIALAAVVAAIAAWKGKGDAL